MWRAFLVLISLALGAAAPAPPSAAGTVLTLCTPDGVREVRVDLGGAPDAAGHDCERCCLTLAAALPTGTGAPPPRLPAARSRRRPGRSPRRPSAHRPAARGPPGPV
ncbi:MAG: hypothetical protein AAFW69_11055 [Pseudomonadota bacterium]